MKQAVRYLGGAAGLVLLLCGGCGGGGAGAAAPAPAPSQAVLHLWTQGPAGQALSGVFATVILPHGVTLRTLPDGSPAGGVLAASGAAQGGFVLAPVYLPETGAVPGTVSFVISTPRAGGFGLGECATLTADLAPGTVPAAASFLLSDFRPADLLVQPATGVTPALTLELK